MDKEIIKALMREENASSEKYRKLAEECPEMSGVFLQISREERTHAGMLEFVSKHI